MHAQTAIIFILLILIVQVSHGKKLVLSIFFNFVTCYKVITYTGDTLREMKLIGEVVNSIT